jgi:hypothetical protein
MLKIILIVPVAAQDGQDVAKAALVGAKPNYILRNRTNRSTESSLTPPRTHTHSQRLTTNTPVPVPVLVAAQDGSDGEPHN